MVVDDQAAFRRVARAVIKATAGFQPIADAASGAEALRNADHECPDLVLMDVYMPQMDGFEATERLTPGSSGDGRRARVARGRGGSRRRGRRVRRRSLFCISATSGPRPCGPCGEPTAGIADRPRGWRIRSNPPSRRQQQHHRGGRDQDSARTTTVLADHTSKADMARRGVDRLRLTCGRPIAKTVAGCA